MRPKEPPAGRQLKRNYGFDQASRGLFRGAKRLAKEVTCPAGMIPMGPRLLGAHFRRTLIQYACPSPNRINLRQTGMNN